MEANKRIDAGIPRKTRKDYRADARRHPRTASGNFAFKIPPEERARIIATVPDRLRVGHSTEQIASDNGIPGSTLRSWLVGSEECEEARIHMLASELMIRAQEIDEANDPLALARAREAFRAYSWLAERRAARLWAQSSKLEVTTNQTPTAPSLLQDAMALMALVRDQRQEKVVSEVPQTQSSIESDPIPRNEDELKP